MDFHDRFRHAASGEGFPEEEVAAFASVLRFRIVAGEHEAGPRAGRLGGLPQLPADIAWPSDTNGSPLPYRFFLDCAALPTIPGIALPATGSLLFFLDAESAMDACSPAGEKEFARVIYVPAGTETATRDAADQQTAPEQDLFATIQAHLPDWIAKPEQYLHGLKQQMAFAMPHRREMRALALRLWPEQPWAHTDVQVGGYSISAQNPPEWVLADADRKKQISALPYPENTVASDKEEFRVMREWVPLAQFGVPEEEYVNGRFLIRHEDLAARRFDEALSFSEFTE
ncbi:YwqG family protein [Actinoplanes sp. NPDC024001]|uniref:YwqG family protein n=1 Tax=Actinoplanes sp. NPDC024001 TaxID=3154598 RepID=UPI0033C4DAF1